MAITRQLSRGRPDFSQWTWPDFAIPESAVNKFATSTARLVTDEVARTVELNCDWYGDFGMPSIMVGFWEGELTFAASLREALIDEAQCRESATVARAIAADLRTWAAEIEAMAAEMPD